MPDKIHSRLKKSFLTLLILEMCSFFFVYVLLISPHLSEKLSFIKLSLLLNILVQVFYSLFLVDLGIMIISLISIIKNKKKVFKSLQITTFIIYLVSNILFFLMLISAYKVIPSFSEITYIVLLVTLLILKIFIFIFSYKNYTKLLF